MSATLFLILRITLAFTVAAGLLAAMVVGRVGVTPPRPA